MMQRKLEEKKERVELQKSMKKPSKAASSKAGGSAQSFSRWAVSTEHQMLVCKASKCLNNSLLPILEPDLLCAYQHSSYFDAFS